MMMHRNSIKVLVVAGLVFATSQALAVVTWTITNPSRNYLNTIASIGANGGTDSFLGYSFDIEIRRVSDHLVISSGTGVSAIKSWAANCAKPSLNWPVGTDHLEAHLSPPPEGHTVAN
jgi:hypothetical protein